MTKGFKDSTGKFRPISTSNATRKKSNKNTKSTGIKTTSGIRKKIRVGENPEGAPKINKFIDGKTGEGLRGTIIALSKNGKEAIIVAKNGSFGKGGVKWGEMYLVREENPDEYPVTVRKVKSVPNTPNWVIKV